MWNSWIGSEGDGWVKSPVRRWRRWQRILEQTVWSKEDDLVVMTSRWRDGSGKRIFGSGSGSDNVCEVKSGQCPACHRLFRPSHRGQQRQPQGREQSDFLQSHLCLGSHPHRSSQHLYYSDYWICDRLMIRSRIWMTVCWRSWKPWRTESIRTWEGRVIGRCARSREERQWRVQGRCAWTNVTQSRDLKGEWTTTTYCTTIREEGKGPERALVASARRSQRGLEERGRGTHY